MNAYSAGVSPIICFRSSFLPFILFFFLYTAVRHDNTSAPYFPRVFFAAVVIVYYRRTSRTMVIAKSIFLRALNASVQQLQCLSTATKL